MCCLCFGRFTVEELSETVDGDKQDVCVPCYEAERDYPSAAQSAGVSPTP